MLNGAETCNEPVHRVVHKGDVGMRTKKILKDRGPGTRHTDKQDRAVYADAGRFDCQDVFFVPPKETLDQPRHPGRVNVLRTSPSVQKQARLPIWKFSLKAYRLNPLRLCVLLSSNGLIHPDFHQFKNGVI